MWWSGVFKAPGDIQWQAAKEVFAVAAVAITPLVVSVILAPAAGIALSEATGKFLLQGQLFLYAMSFCGAIIWHSSLDSPDGKPFPPRIWFMLFVFFSAAITYGVLGVDPGQSEPKPIYLNWLSILLFVGALLLYWCVLVMRTMPPPTIEATNTAQTKDLIAKFDKLRGNDRE